MSKQLHIQHVKGTQWRAWVGDERPSLYALKMYVVSIGEMHNYFCPESTRMEYSTCNDRLASFRMWNRKNAWSRLDNIVEHRTIYAENIGQVRRLYPRAFENRKPAREWRERPSRMLTHWRARRSVTEYNLWRRRAARFAERLAERISVLGHKHYPGCGFHYAKEERIVKLTHGLQTDAPYTRAGLGMSLIRPIVLEMLTADVVRAEKYVLQETECQTQN